MITEDAMTTWGILFRGTARRPAYFLEFILKKINNISKI